MINSNSYMPIYVKLIIHIAIAMITSMVLAIQDYTTFSEISSINWFIIISNTTVQGLNAWKAFSDQSILRKDLELAENKKEPTI